MAIGTLANFRIYDDQVRSCYVETLMQNTALFNAASGGAIVLRTRRLPGQYEYGSFFQNVSSLIVRRDPASVASVTDTELTMGEQVAVKLNRRIGPVANTLDSFRKAGMAADDRALSFLIGTQVAKAQAVDMVNAGLTAAGAALDNVAALKHDATDGTIATSDLVTGLWKMGDMSSNVVAWVMHSKVYSDLIQEQITANVTGIASVAVANGTPTTLNKPVLVVDDASLFLDDAGGVGVDHYRTLGLVNGGVTLEETEEEIIHTELVTGLANLAVRLQGEYAYNVGLRGLAWDVTNGGSNPTLAALGTGSNWDSVYASTKDLAGVIIVSQ